MGYFPKPSIGYVSRMCMQMAKEIWYDRKCYMWNSRTRPDDDQLWAQEEMLRQGIVFG